MVPPMPAQDSLFAYGSLMFPEVWLHVVGHERPATAVTLPGHLAYRVRGYSLRLPPHRLRYPAVSENAFEDKVRDAIANPQNMGEMTDADAVGTVGNADCGDMVRMFIKFSEKDGKKVIDRASFQSFGGQTAIAVASMATEMLKGKSVDEASAISAGEMSADLGALPPMKMHCGQMVEGALRAALEGKDAEAGTNSAPADSGALAGSLASPGASQGKIKIVPTTDDE